ncbi:sulfatase-like hydrolase/transferase [Confluentibacter flavum]|uniref:Sulfatase N-terminal domain-containing protein n=1 Tax=Confluentibacter flavum TaxID=1909700 RepID=A0A2N3HF74_9FLAO|nr:sulfatase-like hydrolase/transferase [Confluentibacter flavum]PKQ43552.1 hypothetical protein CSW08_17950 [Confluentibacter flavum]
MDKKNVNIFLVFLLPIITFFLFELFLKSITIERTYNLIENGLFACLIIILSFLINSLAFKKFFLKMGFIIFNLCLFFETFYYYHFESIFSASAIFVILETNSIETREFLTSYVTKTILFLFGLSIFIIIYGLKIIDKSICQSIIKKGHKLNYLLIFLILVFLKITNLIVYNVPYLAIKTPITYCQETNKLKIYGEDNQLGSFTNVKHAKSKDKKELYIIVIGESASKAHFQLYNYYRKTTPLLNNIKDELIVLNDVISPHAYTIGSLTKGLTLGNVENPEGKYQGSIIQLLNQAGFRTYWISNQRPVGVSDTQVTQIAKGASKSVFLNIKHTSEKTPYDEVLLPELNKIVQEEGDKKVVFLHMIGEHFFYEKRYPPEFDYFKDKPNTKFKRDDVYKTINAYDNAIRYTDSILGEVIKTARKQNSDSFVMYFSDHGQEVYDEIDFFGQTVDQRVTKNMYEIPMLLWMSDSYKLKNQIALNLNNKYMADDVIHSIADLCNVTSNEIDSTRSIFNEHFKERKRIIKNHIDFDTSFYLNENQ